MPVELGGSLTFEDVVAVAVDDDEVVLAPKARDVMTRSRAVVERAAASGHAVYGVTTGIGHLANVHIDLSEAERLQRNIVLSHATAVGPRLPRPVVRAMLLLKARTLASGVTGARVDIAERLVAFLNLKIHPTVPSRGSLGASGDLAPLAHLALPVVGEGSVEMGGRELPAADALREAGIDPIELSYKEGLSLVNGTEMMLGLGILAFTGVERLARTADVTGAMTLEACLGTDRAFDPDLISLRKHGGAESSASNLRRLLEGSEIVASHRESEHLVQDAYSLRCMPQVHGAYRDGLDHIRATFEAELASAIDNPSVLIERGELISGGNFHGEALALASDHLALCASGLGTIAERRVARTVDPALNNGLPAFLTRDAGRSTGFMLAQYTAAALVAENRTLCVPASADTIPTSAGQEDHVSMGATSALKTATIIENAEKVIAIEALVGAQGLELRAPLQPSAGTGAALEAVRKRSAHLDTDRSLSPDIEAVAESVASGDLLEAVETTIGRLA